MAIVKAWSSKVVSAIVLGIPFWGAAFGQCDPKALVTVEETTVRPTGRDLMVAEIRLRNLTSQTVTAYGLTLYVKYPGVKETSQRLTTDSAWVLSLQRIGATPPPNTLFSGGSVVTDSASFPPDARSQVSPVVRVSVDMVALADRTVCGPPGSEIALQDARRRESEQDADIAETLRDISGSSAPGDELARIIATKRAALAGGEANKLGEARLKVVQRAISALLAAGGNLGQARTLYEARRDMMREHSTLRRLEK
jgi:hypothetical protein